MAARRWPELHDSTIVLETESRQAGSCIMYRVNICVDSFESKCHKTGRSVFASLKEGTGVQMTCSATQRRGSSLAGRARPAARVELAVRDKTVN
jgi:hypothetical protein